jgi:hypothetical protein
MDQNEAVCQAGGAQTGARHSVRKLKLRPPEWRPGAAAALVPHDWSQRRPLSRLSQQNKGALTCYLALQCATQTYSQIATRLPWFLSLRPE